MSSSLFVLCLLALVAVALGFRSSASVRLPRVAPLNENFYVDLPTLNDPEKVTPATLLGEAKYKSFVEGYDPDALLVAKYNIIRRVRESKLLTATAESGLLEALEAKGVTLSKLERALPLVDNLGLLPLLIKNKGLLLGLAPLLIEPAPALLPVLAGVLRTPSSLYSGLGLSLAGYGLYDHGNVLLVLLGLPLIALGSVTNGIALPPVPTGTVAVATSSPSFAATKTTRGSRSKAPAGPAPLFVSAGDVLATARSTGKTIDAVPAPKASFSAPKARTSSEGGAQNGKRKTIKIN